MNVQICIDGKWYDIHRSGIAKDEDSESQKFNYSCLLHFGNTLLMAAAFLCSVNC